ncbi:MAG: hypothetical protein JST85_18910 [Acidobacteria bacterium]|nr:hypothetical protein [Acidobacteriota bacterium]
MKWRIQGWNSGGILAVIALLLSVKSLYDVSLNLEGHSKRIVCGPGSGDLFFSALSFLGFALGWRALVSVRKAWCHVLATQHSDPGHRNEWIAVFAMSLAMPAMGMTVSNLTDFSFMRCFEVGRETAATQVLRTIHNNQVQFQAMNARYGTLKELQAAGLIEEQFANGQTIYGYEYSSSDVTAETYCVRAYRTAPLCQTRDFIVCEDGDIRYSEAPTATMLKRGQGKLLAGQNESLPSPTP